MVVTAAAATEDLLGIQVDAPPLTPRSLKVAVEESLMGVLQECLRVPPS
jgi:hypothetical protein